mgnify:FL=1|jgi:hypothetical protein
MKEIVIVIVVDIYPTKYGLFFCCSFEVVLKGGDMRGKSVNG